MLELSIQDFTVSTDYLKVVATELVALDLLDPHNHAGGLNHIDTVFSELAPALNPIKLIKLSKHTLMECQLQRIGYTLEHIDIMCEDSSKIVIDVLEQYVRQNKLNYLPVESEISKISY